MSRITHETPANRILECLEFDRAQMLGELAEDQDFQEISKMSSEEVEDELERFDVDHRASLERSMARLNLADPAQAGKGRGTTALPEATVTGGLRRFKAAPLYYHYGLAAGIVACVAMGCAVLFLQWDHQKNSSKTTANVNESLVLMFQKTQTLEYLLDQQISISNRIQENISNISNDISNNSVTMAKHADYIKEIEGKLENFGVDNEIFPYSRAAVALPSLVRFVGAQEMTEKNVKLLLSTRRLGPLDEQDTKLQSALSIYYRNLFLSLYVKKAATLAQTEK